MPRPDLTVTDWLLAKVNLPPLFARPSCANEPLTTLEQFMGDYGFPGLMVAIVLAFFALLYFMLQIFLLIRQTVPSKDVTTGAEVDDEEDTEEGEEERKAETVDSKSESKKDR